MTDKVVVEASFYEIYNEKVRDLLSSSSSSSSSSNGSQKVSCRVRENPSVGPYVEGLSQVSVKSADELLALLDKGNRNRSVAATRMNEHSSRSHSIFTIVLKIGKREQGDAKVGKISLVDLAGSERVGHAGTSGQRLKEGAKINQSLTALGLVIKALVDQQQSATTRNNTKKNHHHHHIPYRDSILTWLLKESLGGNAKTIMLATVNPLEQYSDESLSTLRYASQAKCIINNAVVNEDPKSKLIRGIHIYLFEIKVTF